MAYKKILFRRDSAAQWLISDPVLSAGEIGLESDTNKIKLGDGSTHWEQLDYFYGSLDDTGYVESLLEGTGVTITNNSGSGATPTISIGQDVSVSSSPAFLQVTLNSLPTDDSHAATKAYVDGIAASINWHDFAVFATAAVLPNTPTYSNGTNGVGATLTSVGNARLVVDGQNASNGQRILVKNQANPIHNGVYVVEAQGSISAQWVLERASDFDSSIYSAEIQPGEALYVGFGATNVNQGFLVVSSGTGTNKAHIIGVDEINFTQFSGTAPITAGTGITKSGNTLAIGQNVATSSSVTFAGVTIYMALLQLLVI